MSPMSLDRNGLGTMSRSDCLRRLGREGVGRVAVSVGALPAIFPINYAMHGDDVVFRTTPGTKLAAAVDGSIVAFEVDDSDRMSHTGWSVLIVGPCHEVTEPAELHEIDHLPLARWARGGGPESIVRIRSELVSGRLLSYPDGCAVDAD